jgi:hypothetical protein
MASKFLLIIAASVAMAIGLSMTAQDARAHSGTLVVPETPLDLNAVSFSHTPRRLKKASIRVVSSCYGTNLRSVSNPLGPDSTIHMIATLRKPNGEEVLIDMKYHADVAKPNPRTGAPYDTVTLTKNSSEDILAFAIAGNTIMLDTGETAKPGAKVYDVQKIEFFQIVPNTSGGEYMAASGPLSAQVSWGQSEDASMLDITAAFPGQNGFCGGYFSPLMVFFDKQRPLLMKQAKFKLRPEGEEFYWPEGSKKWAFIAYDKNKDGKIDDGSELFGADDKFKNGFEALAVLDSNADGVVDDKDPEFGNLLLWFDANSDGVTDADELQPLASKGLTSISLKFDRSHIEPRGRRGQFREHGKAKAGKKTYDVIDVWLGVVKTPSTQPAKKSVRPKK